jgi:7-keto-8-aminopelargonate synthetase-like enzyme
MALFDKCHEFQDKVAGLLRRGQFFYLREVDRPTAPAVKIKGRETIMLGSNNYLGLATHPKVVGATARALREYGTGACS